MNMCEYCARFHFFGNDPNDMFHGGCSGHGEGVNKYTESPCALKMFKDRRTWKYVDGSGCVEKNLKPQTKGHDK